MCEWQRAMMTADRRRGIAGLDEENARWRQVLPGTGEDPIDDRDSAAGGPQCE